MRFQATVLQLLANGNFARSQGQASGRLDQFMLFLFPCTLHHARETVHGRLASGIVEMVRILTIHNSVSRGQWSRHAARISHTPHARKGLKGIKGAMVRVRPLDRSGLSEFRARNLA